MPESPEIAASPEISTERFEFIVSPELMLKAAVVDVKAYGDALGRLDDLTPRFDYGILDDTRPAMERELEEQTLYMRRVAEFYLGGDPESALLDMHYWQFLRLANRMKDEAKNVSLPTLIGEIVAINSTISRHLSPAYKRTIGKMRDKIEEDLNGVEAIASEQAFADITTEKDLDAHGDPAAVLKAVKILNGVSKATLPSEMDYDILRDLTAAGGAITLSSIGPYLNLHDRFRLVKEFLHNMGEPEKVKQMFDEHNWYMHARLMRAPKTLTELLKKYRTAFQEIDTTQEQVARLPQRIHSTVELLHQIADRGLQAGFDKAVTALDEMQAQPDFVPTPKIKELCQPLIKMTAQIKDEDRQDAVRSRLLDLVA